MKKILIFPNTNTLSHLARAFALAGWLKESGFEVHLGISSERISWARKFHPLCHELTELWEFSKTPYPCLEWFHDREHIRLCIEAQKKLIREIKPSLIIGIFDFVSALTCRDLPRISINGACMLPFFKGVMGFDESPSPEREKQKSLLESFWKYAFKPFEPWTEALSLKIETANGLLVGDRNLIYESPALCPVSEMPPHHFFLGPIFWKGWDFLGEKPPPFVSRDKKVIYYNSGTLPKNSSLLNDIVRECLNENFNILVSTSRQDDFLKHPHIFSSPYLSPSAATKMADIVICSGGIGACSINLLHETPSVILPEQPEQSTNGIHLERAGCGKVLMKNIPYIGNSDVYYNTFSMERFKSSLEELLCTDAFRNSLHKAAKELQSLVQAQTLVQTVESLL